MKIVSLNAWGGTEFDALAEWLPGCGADVVCLQEVTRTPGLGGWTRFADGERTLPQRANLYDDVRALLPQHQATFVTSDAGPVCDAEGRWHRQDFGIAMFVHDSIPVIGNTSTFIHGAFVDHEEWPIGDRPRVAQGARFVDRGAHRTMSVVHLHGLRDPVGKVDTPARRNQAERLRTLVAQLRDPNDLVVVAGDFNLLPHSETFQILGAIGLVDLVGTNDTRTSLYQKEARHADYLLTTGPDDVNAFEILAAPEVSDHRPLIVDF